MKTLIVLMVLCCHAFADPAEDIAELRAKLSAERMRGDEMAGEASRMEFRCYGLVGLFAITAAGIGLIAFRSKKP